MEKGWVMTEEERTQQLKVRQEKRRDKKEEEERRRLPQDHRLTPHEPLSEDRHLFLCDDDVKEIDDLISLFYEMYKEHPMPAPGADRCAPNPSSHVVDIFISSVSRVVGYVTALPRFQQLKRDDQRILLKNGVLAMVILRGAMVFEPNQGKFVLKTTQKATAAPTVQFDEIRHLLAPDLFESHYKFVQAIKNLGLDETTLMLLQMVVLYSSDKMGLSEPALVGNFQDHYTDLIRRYMNWYYGEENTRLLYPRMLHRLTDLRTLTEAHTQSTVIFTDPDVGKIAEGFKKMNFLDEKTAFNPYPSFPEFLQKPVRHRSEAELGRAGADPPPARVRCRLDRERGGAGPARPPPAQRSLSLPVYHSDYGRRSQAAAPHGAESAGYQPDQTPAYQPDQQFAADYGAAQFGGQQACAYGVGLPHQWSPGYQEQGVMSVWADEMRPPRQTAPGGFAAHQGYAPFSAMLGVGGKGRDEKRPKTEPASSMMPLHHHHMTSPQMTSPQMTPHSPAGGASHSYGAPAPGQQPMTPPFFPYCSSHSYDPSRGSQF